MRRTVFVPGLILAVALTIAAAVAACTTTPQAETSSTTTATTTSTTTRWSHQDWPTGHYRVVENWPKPLPDARHSHDGWTWGSFGGVYAENPDRIWVAMRGELPLPNGAIRPLPVP